MTTGPVAEPTTGGILPAPLYFIDAKGQISRIEIDGTTIIQITDEADPIMDFAVSPADGSLAYLTVADTGVANRLISSDAMGQGRTELLYGLMRNVAIPYTGESIEVGVLDPACQRPDGARGA